MWIEDKQLWLNRAERRMLLGYRKPRSTKRIKGQ